MKKDKQGWGADFPMREEVEDYTGRARVFVINCHEGGLGFTVRAEEEGGRGDGYQFAAYRETSPYRALGRLRQKMHRALATRHITGSHGAYRMLHDKLSGRITSDGKGGVVLVVDGIALGIEDLASILAAHEGWALNFGSSTHSTDAQADSHGRRFIEAGPKIAGRTRIQKLGGRITNGQKCCTQED